MSKFWKFQANWSNNTLKTGFFRITGKTGCQMRIYLGLKPHPDQDELRISQISQAVPEEIGIQAYTHANIVLLYNRDKWLCHYKI